MTRGGANHSSSGVPLRDQKAYQTSCHKLVNSSNAIVHIELCGGAQFRVELRKSVLVIGDFSDAGDLRLLIFDVYQRSL